MRCCANIFRLLRLLVQRIPDRITVLPLGRMMTREHGVSITFKMDSVVKRVKSFNTQLNCNPDFDIVREVTCILCCEATLECEGSCCTGISWCGHMRLFALVACCVPIVIVDALTCLNNLQVYNATSTSSNVVHGTPELCEESGVYSVELEPLGYVCLPSSEHELKCAIKGVLSALVDLHGRGFVHRDLRWDNILRTARVRITMNLKFGSVKLHLSMTLYCI